MERVPETPPRQARVLDESGAQAAQTLPLQSLDRPVEEVPVDSVNSSKDEVQLVDAFKPAPLERRLIGGHTVRPPPAPPTRQEVEKGTAHWMRKGDRVTDISKALTQILRRAAPRLGVEMQEDGYVDMGALLRAPRFWRQWVKPRSSM